MTDACPKWFDGPVPEASWRALLKWGSLKESKHPNAGLVRLMQRTFGMSEADFAPRNLGLEPAVVDAPSRLPDEALVAFRELLGPENVVTDGLARLRVAYGKTMVDLLRLRQGIVEHLPDAVLHPRDRHDVEGIVALCGRFGIPLTPFGGGTSVTRGVECMKGGVSLDLRTHMNKVIGFNEVDQTITVEAGLYGPELELLLNRAPELFGAHRAYTCGHFPQSFEFATVGGWVVTRGAGQNSTYYGKIEDLVLAQEMVTPRGVIRTQTHPAAATGPDTDQILMGSEGAFGVLTQVTLRIHRHLPEAERRFSYLFPDFASAISAARECLQSEGGRPSVFRVSDAEETDVVMKLYGVDRPWVNALSSLAGLKPGSRCLMLGTTGGTEALSRVARRNLGRICRRFGGRPTSGLVTRAWEHGRFRDPYLRDDLQDVGILIDTLECTVTWDTLERVHRGVRAAAKARPHTICMTHLSHAYPQGANLYFIFIARMDDIGEYQAYQAEILDAILAHGATMSHHHGIGKMTAPWLEAQIGPEQLALFRALKRHFDPANLMNPGGTLALDLPDSKRRDTKLLKNS
ncbi:MAG TPA: FAD-binding oxidoreductase [Geothrix sp.]|nr:FAD-binding oxidoreductase [Geothrix sp.]